MSWLWTVTGKVIGLVLPSHWQSVPDQKAYIAEKKQDGGHPPVSTEDVEIIPIPNPPPGPDHRPLKIIYGGIECTDPGNAALYDFIDHRRADIVSNSYGFNGEALPADFIQTENQYFMQAAAETGHGPWPAGKPVLPDACGYETSAGGPGAICSAH